MFQKNKKVSPFLKSTLLVLIGITAFIGCGTKKNPPTPSPTPTPTDTTTTKPVKTDVTFWLSKPDKSVLLQKQTQTSLLFHNPNNGYTTIDVDTTQTFQTMEGFGFALTGASANLIDGLAVNRQDSLLNVLVSSDSNGIGISYLRISIGASDLSLSPYTYDEVVKGQTDTTLSNFSINREKAYLIPVLQKILAINPNIKIIASPWTAPLWMKTNDSYWGGSLQRKYFSVYAKYFVKYIKAMESYGIHITAITPQNEPLNQSNDPSMYMSAQDQDTFVKEYLGPAFQANNINTEIVIFDHNLDKPEYPISILSDTEAAKYIYGSAYHGYAGRFDEMSRIHYLFPSKKILFTEQYLSTDGTFSVDIDWHTQNLMINVPRNWSTTVIEWNLASNETASMHTQGGCSVCLGALTIASSGKITKNANFYSMAHTSKFVPAGSVRIASSNLSYLPNIAYLTPSGKKVLLVINTGNSTVNFNIKFRGKIVTPTLTAGAIGTFIWN